MIVIYFYKETKMYLFNKKQKLGSNFYDRMDGTYQYRTHANNDLRLCKKKASLLTPDIYTVNTWLVLTIKPEPAKYRS